MRYGVIADVHGNLEALRPVLRAIDREGVDGYLVAGDLVGYGPHPNECVAAVAELGATSVPGTHDLIALGILSDDRCIALARHSLRWTRQILGRDERAFLAALPRVATAPGGVRVAHGSLDDPQQYTTAAGQALAQLDRLDDGDRALVLGHTHRPLAYTRSAGRLPTRGATALPPGEAVLLNPGAVGQSREQRVRARFAILDLDARQARFGAVAYDVGACRAALRRAGLAPRSYHLRPSLPRAAVRALRERRLSSR